MGRHVQIEWQESAEELKALYKRERHPQQRTRLQVLWQLRTGKRIVDVVENVGVSYRAVQQWAAWYRVGGLDKVLHHVTGHGSRGATPYLNAKQQRALAARVELGGMYCAPFFGHGIAVRYGTTSSIDCWSRHWRSNSDGVR